METRLNRRALIEGINRMLKDVPFRLLELMYLLLRYFNGEED